MNESTWEIYDPDKILTYKLKGFNVGILSGGDIHPREDLFYLKHKVSNYLIDYGYYGCGTKLDGIWTVYVIDGNREDGWDSPIERHDSTEFLEGIKNVQEMVEKYT